LSRQQVLRRMGLEPDHTARRGRRVVGHRQQGSSVCGGQESTLGDPRAPRNQSRPPRSMTRRWNDQPQNESAVAVRREAHRVRRGEPPRP
jgi:hypothetical protein